MRRPSARIFNDPVTLRVVTWSNVNGARVASTADTAARASVQPASANRLPQHLRATAEISHAVYFAADPGLKVDDLIVWGTHTLAVESPAIDEAGRGAMFTVFCTEHD